MGIDVLAELGKGDNKVEDEIDDLNDTSNRLLSPFGVVGEGGCCR